MKTSTVTPSFYYVFNIFLCCNDAIPSFIGNLWRVLLLGNYLKNSLQSVFYPRELLPWVGVCGVLPKTFILFTTPTLLI